MGIFKKTIKYSKPLKDLESKIKNLDEELKNVGVIANNNGSEDSFVQESFVENLPKIYDKVEVQREEEKTYNWRESFVVEESEDFSTVDNYNDSYQKTVKKVESYISESNKELIEIRDQVFQEISQSTLLNLPDIKCKIEKVLEIYDQIQEGLLNEPPETKNEDPLTPLNQNFVTVEELNKHYSLFINRIQEQIATIGGGGETKLKYLDDVVGIATDAASYDGKFLKYDHSLGKFVFETVVGGGGGGSGAQGSQGVQGAQGIEGAQGAAGFIGSNGAQGVEGAQGFQGFQGVQGTNGTVGTQGVQGATGSGVQGSQGVQGAQGPQGPSGSEGNGVVDYLDARTANVSGISTLGFFSDKQIVSHSESLGENTTYYSVHKDIIVSSGSTLTVGTGSTIILDRFNNLDDVRANSLISSGIITALTFNGTLKGDIIGITTLGFFGDEQIIHENVELGDNTKYYSVHKNITVDSGSTLTVGTGSTIIFDRFNNLDDVTANSIHILGASIFDNNLSLNSSLKDFYGNVGAAGSVLISTGAGVSWTNIVSGTGTQGSQGVQGADGAQGIQGAAGTGAQGAQGVQGSEGAQGVQGATGTGAQGIQGATGTGAQGVQGAQGPSGGGGGESYWASTTVGIYTFSNVGIGTTNPTSALTVQGDGVFSGVVTATRFESTSAGTPTIESPNNLNINAVTVAISTDLSIGGQVISNVIVGSGKSIGIGTANPTQSLDINENIRIRGGIYDSNNNVGTAGSVLSSTGSGWQWISLSSGPQGSQGSQGIQGATGTGVQGSQGIQGATGSSGSNGAQGVQGTIGSQGSQGIQGAQGSPGLTGAQGSAGDTFWASTSVGIHTLSNVGIGTTNPTSTLTVKGNTSLETLNVSGVSTIPTLRGNVTLTGTLTADGLALGDNETAVFGDSDLIIKSDGNKGVISGGLLKENYLLIQNPVNSNYIAKFQPVTGDGSDNVELYHSGSKKFETLGAGATVTGTTFTNQLSVSGVTTITGNLNAPGNYYVKLARTSNQTITNGADTLIGFTATSDTNGWYSGITTRTIPTVAGTYRVDVMLNWQAGSVTNNQTNIQLRKNGTTFALSQVGIQTFAYTQTACGIVTMNGTSDYIDFTVFTGNPTSQVVTGTADGAWTKMEIFKIN